MKKSAFNEAKPRTPKGEARQREITARKAIEELIEIADEGSTNDDLQNALTSARRCEISERVGYLEGTARREALSLFTSSENAVTRAFFSASERPKSSI
jgi:hypothetical protein